MKLDLETWLGIIICAIILMGWEPIGRSLGWIPAPNASSTNAEAPAVAAPSEAETMETADQVVPASRESKSQSRTAPAVPTAVAVKPAAPQSDLEISNRDLKLSINPLSGAVTAIQLRDYKNAAQTEPLSIDVAAGERGALSVSAPGTQWITTAILDRKVGPDSGMLVREVATAAGECFEMTQRWELGVSGYRTAYTFTIRNSGKHQLFIPGLLVDGGNLGPWRMVSGDKVRLPSHRLDYLTINGDFVDIKADKKDETFFSGGSPMVRWAAVGNKYFCLILSGREPFSLNRSRFYIGSGKEAAPCIAASAALPGFVLAPGGEKSFSFEFYSGPKILRLLDEFNPSVGKVMHLAWGPLNYLARLMLWILVKLHALTGNYGWSIILLTLLVRIVFYPITARGNASMKKMQAIQPKIKELREKYKTNPQLMNTKMMELYRAEGVNPFGGCLPILLQIPVFFALYATLEGAVELRQSSFFWCHDLAAADTVAHVNLYFFTLPINPLVLAMTGLMVLQQHMTPMSMDPMQRRMMLLMPFIMLFFFYDLPSGLTLYWTVSNIFSIIQLRLQQRGSKSNVAAGAARN